MTSVAQNTKDESLQSLEQRGRVGPTGRMCGALVGLTSVVLAMSGCGGNVLTATPANSVFSISPETSQIDTNCTGCNWTNLRGSAAHRFTATLNNGNVATVVWSLSGGDKVAGVGSITPDGKYTPPSYLSADHADVLVTATLTANPAMRATSVLRLTPGFLQPLTPENVALNASGSVTITGFLAEAGGSGSIRFALSDTPTGTSGGLGSLSATNCQRTEKAFTSCSVTYSAPATVQGTGVTYVVASLGSLPPRLKQRFC